MAVMESRRVSWSETLTDTRPVPQVRESRPQRRFSDSTASSRGKFGDDDERTNATPPSRRARSPASAGADRRPVRSPARAPDSPAAPVDLSIRPGTGRYGQLPQALAHGSEAGHMHFGHQSRRASGGFIPSQPKPLAPRPEHQQARLAAAAERTPALADRSSSAPPRMRANGKRDVYDAEMALRAAAQARANYDDDSEKFVTSWRRTSMFNSFDEMGARERERREEAGRGAPHDGMM